MNLISRDGFLDSIFSDSFYEPVFRNNNVLKSDVYELDGNYVIDMDIPGLKKEDVNIDYEDGYLSVVAKKEEEKEENTNYLRRERYYGEYKRSFYIGEINETDIKAKFNNGVLKVIFPKNKITEKAPKQINIE